MKKLIGIVPKGMLFDMEKSNFSDVYHVGNNYAKRVAEAGGIPLSIAPVDGYVTEEMLEPFDGFIIQGGHRFWPYHYQVMHHAAVHGKKVLGICLGHQLIHGYFNIRNLAEKLGLHGDMGEITYRLLRDPGVDCDPLERVMGHRSEAMPRGQEDIAKQDVDIVPGTLLHQLLGKDKIRAASFHDYRITPPLDCITINARAADDPNTIEGIEYGDNFLGVQFHPEVDTELANIFTFLTKD